MYNANMNEIKSVIEKRKFEDVKDCKFVSDSERQLVLLGIEILKTIKTYRQDCNSLHERITKKEGALASFSSRLFLSKSTFFQDSIHEKYYLTLNKQAKQIKELIKSVNNNELQNVIADAIMQDITVPANAIEKKFIRINYDADDYIFHDLIVYISNDTLNKIFSDFINRRASSILPNQKKLIKELKQEFKNRDISVPKKPFKLF